MCETRQKKKTVTQTRTSCSAALIFFANVTEGCKFHCPRELIFYLCSLFFSTSRKVFSLNYLMSTSPFVLFIPCRFWQRLAQVLPTHRQLVTIEKPWHQFQSLSILLVRFLFICNSTILQIQCLVSLTIFHIWTNNCFDLSRCYTLWQVCQDNSLHNHNRGNKMDLYLLIYIYFLLYLSPSLFMDKNRTPCSITLLFIGPGIIATNRIEKQGYSWNSEEVWKEKLLAMPAPSTSRSAIITFFNEHFPCIFKCGSTDCSLLFDKAKT